MAVAPVPALFVGLTDPRLFPSEELLEAMRVEAKEKQLPPTRPVLYTTVGEEPVQDVGCKGKCEFKDCECLYFALNKLAIAEGEKKGKPYPAGECARCHHANLYHRVKIRRVDLEAKAAADALKKMKHRRHIPTQKEIEEQKDQQENKPPEPVNNYPCDVPDCECKRMGQPPGWDPATLLPKLCRGCKHAEMYHIKRKKEDKNKRRSTVRGKSASTKGGKAGSTTSTARGTSRGTTSQSGRKSATAKKK